MRVFSVFAFALALVVPQLATAEDPYYSCVQELWYDFPGPTDLYIALNKPEDCSGAGEEDLWWGAPSHPIPQNCDDDECENYQGGNRRGAQILPGHGQSLVGSQAWDVYRVGLESAARKMPGLEFGAPSYHRISRRSIPHNVQGNGDIFVMAIPVVVHARGSRIDGNTYYLCIQIDSLGREPESAATFEDGKFGKGSQLRINYDVNGQKRKGLVWLK